MEGSSIVGGKMADKREVIQLVVINTTDTEVKCQIPANIPPGNNKVGLTLLQSTFDHLKRLVKCNWVTSMKLKMNLR